ncbi:MAG: FUSC family protein [Bacteroidetes bacterium]|nr:FUSC family protein [Bacteroidota bacterium]MBI3483391.1 FUSC family protein [Bacteroidota bacterium]
MSRNKMMLVYVAKCVSGVLLCSLLSIYFSEWIDYAWSLISVVLVLSPEGKDSVELALTRIKANLVGASVGVLMLLSQISWPWNLAAGAALALFICDRLKLNAAARSTLAAVIIILLQADGQTLWGSAINRVGAVITGCALGLMITFVFHSFIKLETPAMNSEATKKEREA